MRRQASKNHGNDQPRVGDRVSDDPANVGLQTTFPTAKPNVGRSGVLVASQPVEVRPPRIFRPMKATKSTRQTVPRGLGRRDHGT